MHAIARTAPILASAVLAVLLPALAFAQEPAKKPYRSAKEIIDAAPASAWRDLDPANTLYMQLPAGRVVIELAPGFAPNHVANIKALAQGGFWDGTSIYRSQGQLRRAVRRRGRGRSGQGAAFPGEREGQIAGGVHPRQHGRGVRPAARRRRLGAAGRFRRRFPGRARSSLGKDMDDALLRHRRRQPQQRAGQQHRRRALRRHRPGPARAGPQPHPRRARGEGMELLSAIPRGPDPMGFYEKAEQRTPIVSIRLASDVPAAERTPLQLLRTDTQAFRDATEARRNRVDDFYQVPAGHRPVQRAVADARSDGEVGLRFDESFISLPGACGAPNLCLQED